MQAAVRAGIRQLLFGVGTWWRRLIYHQRYVNLVLSLQVFKPVFVVSKKWTKKEEFDGVWACASLLHVPEAELGEVINRLVRALKTKGVLYMSFKYGAGERVAEDGRFFVDMTEDRIHDVVQRVQNLKVQRVWRTLGEGKFEGQGEWLNALVSKRWALEDV